MCGQVTVRSKGGLGLVRKQCASSRASSQVRRHPLRDARFAAGVAKGDLAERAGVSVWSISRAERGERISAKTAQALLAALGAGGDVDLLTQFFSPRARVHALRCGSAARNMATMARVAGRALCRLRRTRFRRPAATAKRLIIGKELNRHPCSPVPSSAHSCSR